jgi:hypothetical protein
MATSSNKKRTTSGIINRLRKLAQEVPEERRCIAESYTTELAFMLRTLDELRADIQDNGTVELFQNGAQVMRRENPALKSYNTTIQRYNQTFKQFIDLLPDASAEVSTELQQFMAEPMVFR